MRLRGLGLIFLVVWVLGTFAGVGWADDGFATHITAADQLRLDGFATNKTAAIAEAKAGGAAGDIDLLKAAFAGDSQTLGDVSGRWRCRVIKLGKMLPLVVYPQFKCLIAKDGAHLKLEKLSGSQRTSGTLYADGDGRMIYLGGYFTDGDPPAVYGAGKDTDQIAVLERLAPHRLVLQFPAPEAESLFDLLVMEKAGVP
jgi:hypothetical protein